ncbi:MAG: hypothetical protein AAB874_07450 [Patescibacteria group bacterium]
MKRNTNLLIIFLGVLATFLFGVRVNTWLNGDRSISQASPTPSAQPLTKSYTNKYCGISFDYSVDYLLNEATESARLVHTRSGDMISTTCSKELPKPPLPANKIETASVSGQKATLYHDASSKDGTPIDVVMFKHPKKGLEIAILGFGEEYKRIVESLKLTD